VQGRLLNCICTLVYSELGSTVGTEHCVLKFVYGLAFLCIGGSEKMAKSFSADVDSVLEGQKGC
jgi:hypothetical protein